MRAERRDQMWKIMEQCSMHCLPVLSFTGLITPVSPQRIHVPATRSPLWIFWDSVRNFGSSAFGQSQAHDTDGYN